MDKNNTGRTRKLKQEKIRKKVQGRNEKMYSMKICKIKVTHVLES
jgi:hypothetical protein